MRIVKTSLAILLVVLFFSCQKEYSIEGIVLPAGTWQFNDSTKLYTGNMDSAYIETTGTTKTLNLKGRSADGQQNFLLHLYATDSFTIGTYKASLFQSDFQYYTQSKTIYQADQFVGEFIVTITAISNNTITGIFAGLSQDSANAVKPLTLGKFTSRINLSTNGTGGGGAGSASGTLGVSAGACTPVTFGGTYTQGIALTSTNTASVQVTVTNPGTYTITTNTVNGVTFSKTGTFTANGIQTVILNGSGIPVNSGNQTFAVTFGSSTCNFMINFIAGTPPPPVTDYFPTTVGSYWALGKQGGVPSDSLLFKVITYQLTAAGNTYSTITVDSIPASGNPDSLYYRKGGGLYYEYFNAETFFGFDPGTTSPKYVEYIFLKDNVAQGTTWNSPNITGTSSGMPYTIYIKMTLTEKMVPVTVGTYNFPDVDKVKYEYFVNVAPGTPFFTEERWFAKGVGLIYNSFYDGTTTTIYKVGRYQIF